LARDGRPRHRRALRHCLLVDGARRVGPAAIRSTAAAERDGDPRPGGKVPGFGHPLHKPVDPRAERILALADERGVAGARARSPGLRAGVVADVWGRPLPMNVSMPIAAVLLDLDFPPR
jgi:citrate synthase